MILHWHKRDLLFSINLSKEWNKSVFVVYKTCINHKQVIDMSWRATYCLDSAIGQIYLLLLIVNKLLSVGKQTKYKQIDELWWLSTFAIQRRTGQSLKISSWLPYLTNGYNHTAISLERNAIFLGELKVVYW